MNIKFIYLSHVLRTVPGEYKPLINIANIVLIITLFSVYYFITSLDWLLFSCDVTLSSVYGAASEIGRSHKTLLPYHCVLCSSP